MGGLQVGVLNYLLLQSQAPAKIPFVNQINEQKISSQSQYHYSFLTNAYNYIKEALVEEAYAENPREDDVNEAVDSDENKTNYNINILKMKIKQIQKN